MAQKMANSKKLNEISFEEKLWETAEQLRGKVEVSNYKYIALGLMFLKFISERYNIRRNELDQETRDPKNDNYCKSEKDREYLLNLKDQYTSKGIFCLLYNTYLWRSRILLLMADALISYAIVVGVFLALVIILSTARAKRVTRKKETLAGTTEEIKHSSS